MTHDYWVVTNDISPEDLKLDKLKELVLKDPDGLFLVNSNSEQLETLVLHFDTYMRNASFFNLKQGKICTN